MQCRRILVLGCSGSGKSTFARRLGALTGLPVIHLDRLFWKPGWVQPTKVEYHTALREALAQETWIMDGDYSSTLPMRLLRCDQIIYFELPRRVCMWGVLTRVFKSYGKTRPDMGADCPEKFDWEFMKYTWNFKKSHADNRTLIYSSGKHVVTFRSRRDARRYLEGIEHDDA